MVQRPDTGQDTLGPSEPSPAAAHLTYRPALEGLRAVAIIAVVAFHFDQAALPGGYLGVDVFFALSGFLITALLLAEHASTGSIRLRPFYARRARRLLPALALFLLVWLALALLFGRHGGWFTGDPFGSPRGGPLPVSVALRGVVLGVTYTFNWARAWDKVLPPLGHLWSLGVEEQFYLFWPGLMRALLRRRPKALLATTVALALVSALLPLALWHGGKGADRIYFSTDTRMQSILIGAVAAQLWSRGAWARLGRGRAWLAACGGATVLALSARLGNQSFKYLGAFAVTGLAASGMIAYFADAGTTLAHRVLGSRPMRWVGARSYAIYLWHPALAGWTRGLDPLTRATAAIGGSTLLAAASWNLVERKFRPARSTRADSPQDRPRPAPV